MRHEGGSRRIAAGALWFLLPVGSLLAGGCLSPPAILQASALPLPEALALYPTGSEPRILWKPDGRVLSAVHVPAQPDSPLILHLLDSSGSLAGIGADFGVLAHQLRELGFASLFFDYTGAGLSDGERSIENLRPDTGAAWSAALRLAGGDPERIIVRGISIGTVAAAQLLEDGARPRAMLWIAPVAPATVVPRFARQFHGFWAWLAASLFFRPISRLDPGAVVTEAGVPVHVLGSVRDPLLSPREREELERAARKSGGTWHDTGADHVYMGIRARRMTPEELAILRPLARPREASDSERILHALPAEVRARFAEDPEARERLGHLAATQSGATPIELAAGALANDDWVDSWRMLWLHRIRPFPELGFDDLVAALSLRNPRGKLAAELVEYLSAPHDQAWRYDRTGTALAPRLVGAISARRGEPYRVSYQLRCGVKYDVAFDLDQTWISLLLEGRLPDDATTELARYLLKGLRIPDRCRELSDGSLELQAYWEERWETVPCTLAP